MKHSLSLEDLDRLAHQIARDRGRPLPQMAISARFQRLIDLVEAKYGVRVMVRPHTFSTGNYGMHARGENKVTVFGHPDFPEDESIRILIHEGGHCEQQLRNIERDRDQIEEYVEHENEADELGYELADLWGVSDLFPEDYRADRRKLHEDLYLALDGLSYATGVQSAILLTAIADQIRYFYDPNIGKSLKKQIGKEFLTFAELAELCYEHPELLIGYDRAILTSSIKINRVQPTEKNRLEVENPEDAAAFLRSLLGERASGRARNQRTLVGDREKLCRFAWYEGHYGLGSMLQEVEKALLNGRGEAVAVSWEYVDSSDHSIYEARIEWDQAPDTPDHRLIWYLDGYEKQRGRARQYENALRFFINCFSNHSLIIRRSSSEFMGNILWLLLGNDDAPRKVRTPAEEKELEFRSWADRLLNETRSLDVVSNPAPEALFEAERSGVSIYATRDDCPDGWQSVPMYAGAFAKPCEQVAEIWWDGDQLLHLKTRLPNHGERNGRQAENHPADIAWSLGKLEHLLQLAGLPQRPILIDY